MENIAPNIIRKRLLIEGFYSMEIMMGRRVDSSDPEAQTFAFLMMSEAMFPTDKKKFYEGFAHSYWPKRE